MPTFQLPADLWFNRGRIGDPKAYATERRPASWLCLTGEEFAAMDGGISFAQVRDAIAISRNVISDPPRTLSLELARLQVEALDALPRPTLVSCRMGPRSSAGLYMYAGLRGNAEPDDVLEAARIADAPFIGAADCVAWVVEAITTLRREGR